MFDIFDDDAIIQRYLQPFSFCVRTFFPQEIKAGFISFDTYVSAFEVILSKCISTIDFDVRPRITSSIMCDAGSIDINIPLTQDMKLFAKQLHQCSSRENDYRKDLNFETQESSTVLSNEQTDLFPLLKEEKIIEQIVTNKYFSPCFKVGNSHIFDKQRIGFLFPMLPSFLTCGLFPLFGRNSYLVTNKSLYFHRSKRNEFCLENALNLNQDFVGIPCIYFTLV